ncbi:MAG: hypothetical protein AAF936_10420 [Pseudomonadota bacterium]
MPKLSEIITPFAKKLAMMPASMKVLAMHLRNDNQITKGGRGRGAPKMTAADGVNLMLAGMIIADAKDIAHYVHEARRMKPFPRGVYDDRLNSFRELTLGAALDLIFERLVKAKPSEFGDIVFTFSQPLHYLQASLEIYDSSRSHLADLKYFQPETSDQGHDAAVFRYSMIDMAGMYDLADIIAGRSSLERYK